MSCTHSNMWCEDQLVRAGTQQFEKVGTYHENTATCGVKTSVGRVGILCHVPIATCGVKTS